MREAGSSHRARKRWGPTTCPFGRAARPSVEVLSREMAGAGLVFLTAFYAGRTWEPSQRKVDWYRAVPLFTTHCYPLHTLHWRERGLREGKGMARGSPKQRAPHHPTYLKVASGAPFLSVRMFGPSGKEDWERKWGDNGRKGEDVPQPVWRSRIRGTRPGALASPPVLS